MLSSLQKFKYHFLNLKVWPDKVYYIEGKDMEIKCNKSKSLDWFVNGGGTFLFLIRDLRSFVLSILKSPFNWLIRDRTCFY